MLNNEIKLLNGDNIEGFLVKAVTPLSELRMVAYQFEHLQSGARLLHLHTDDAENLFSISFPTPPPDDTGIPHILEHAVLSGSHRYPVRDPFFEMFKMSMATFINAMTGWDCTYYPVASNVKQDLFNLAFTSQSLDPAVCFDLDPAFGEQFFGFFRELIIESRA